MIIRQLTELSEFEKCVELQRETWGSADIDIIPVRMFVTQHRIGGLVLGAFDQEQFIAFLNAMPGIRDGMPYWYSEMLAVSRAHRNTGVGFHLKLAQRDHARQRGIRLIEWTFDPLESKNAYLNVAKLGVIARRYYVNLYGVTTSRLQQGLESDRLVAEWWIDEPRAAAAGEIRRLRIPADIQALKKQSLPSARDMQLRVRDQFLKNFQDDYFITGFERKGEWSEYLFLPGHRVFIKQIEMRELRMRLLHPFETSFGATQERHVVLVKVTDGTDAGWGEVTAAEGPFYSYETWETAWHVLSDYVLPSLVGREMRAAAEFGQLVRGIRGHNMAKAGIETALWDLEAKVKDVPLWRMLGGTRERIDCGVSIGIQQSIDRLLAAIDAEVKAGYRRIKIKIKPGWDTEVIREVRAAFPTILLMGDANSAYTLADINVFKEMDKYNVMMFEQPLHYEDIIDHAALQKQIETPICLDESIHSADDARKAIQIGACKIINVKLGRVGGHSQARALHDICSASGVPVWCGGMLESGIGRAHNAALSSLDNFSLPGDVSASKRYWSEDIIEPPVEVSPEGHIWQRGEPGIGYSIKEDLIERLTVRSRVFSA